MNNLKKAAVGTACMLMLAGAGILMNAKNVSAEESVIISADFENGENPFTRRGENETLEITDEISHSGTSSLCVSTRAKSWNGPQVALDDLIEAGQQYVVTAYAKTEWYSQLTLSMQYDDSEGTTHYSNIVSKSNDGGSWSEYENIKFSFPAGSTAKYLYFEAGDSGVKIYVDDFKITEAPDVEIEDLTSLRAYYSDAFKIGTAITAGDLSSKPFMKLVNRHFSGSITPGNELKPDSVLNKKACQEMFAESGDDTNPQITLAAAKSILQYCSDNKIPMRGHTLVWHSQTPDWFFKEGYDDEGEWVSAEKMTLRMENYIKNVMETLEKEYPDLEIYAWDVVNEAWQDNGTPRQAGSNNVKSGQSAWVQVYGDNSFIEDAFRFARKYAPEGTKLYYNDYNEYIDQKTKAIVEMAESLKEKGLIDGIGMQSHLDVGFPTASVYKKTLGKFAATGLDIQVTELDITTSDLSEAGYENQAKVYSDIMDALYEYRESISAVIFWGVTDDASWRAAKCPLLFAEDYTAKPAYYSIIDGLEAGEVTLPEASPSQTVKPTAKATEEPAVTEPAVSETPSSAPASEVTATPTEKLYGDSDGNGTVDITDLSLVSLYLIGDAEIAEENMKYTDVDADGSVTLADLATLRQYLSKIVDRLGPEK